MTAPCFTLPLPVTIRPCREDDLEKLEWFGLFTPHREIIARTFESVARGGNAMLVAEAGGFPVGQAWVDLTRADSESVGVLWAVRVFPFLQGLGIGARLIGAAEDLLRARGVVRAEITVEKDNPGAKRLYERLGYRLEGTLGGEYTYTTPEGAFVRVPVDQWVLRKELGDNTGEDGRTER